MCSIHKGTYDSDFNLSLKCHSQFYVKVKLLFFRWDGVFSSTEMGRAFNFEIKGLVHLSARGDRSCDIGQIRQQMVFTHFDFTGIRSVYSL